MMKKIAILCGDDYHHKYLVNLYKSLFEVEVVIIEPLRMQRLRLLKEVKYVDYLYSIYHKLRRDLFGLNSFREKVFKFAPSDKYQVNELIVDNINHIDVIPKLIDVDLVVVICTSIIKGELLNQIKGKAINIHGGYLPNYRGNHCFFFALYKKDHSKIGSTIHFIDQGIDTGDIIEHCIPIIEDGDTPEKLYCKSEMLAIHRLSELIKSHDSVHQIRREKQLKKYKLYRNRDRGVMKDLIFMVRRIKNT